MRDPSPQPVPRNLHGLRPAVQAHQRLSQYPQYSLTGFYFGQLDYAHAHGSRAVLDGPPPLLPAVGYTVPLLTLRVHCHVCRTLITTDQTGVRPVFITLTLLVASEHLPCRNGGIRGIRDVVKREDAAIDAVASIVVN